MKRFVRFTLNALLFLAAALFLATAALYVRSFYVADFIWHNDPGAATGVFVARGHAMVTRRTPPPPLPTPPPGQGMPGPIVPVWERFHERPPGDLFAFMTLIYGPGSYGHRAGFAWAVTREGNVVASREVVAPLWAPLVVLGVPTAWGAWRLVAWWRTRRRRVMQGFPVLPTPAA